MEFATGDFIIRQLHHVIKVARVVIAADLENIDEARMAAGNGLELLNAFELPFIGTLVVELRAVDNFHRAIGSDNVPGEPNLAVAALADEPDKLVIWNHRCNRRFRWAIHGRWSLSL